MTKIPWSAHTLEFFPTSFNNPNLKHFQTTKSHEIPRNDTRLNYAIDLNHVCFERQSLLLYWLPSSISHRYTQVLPGQICLHTGMDAGI
jgi:hypothetical protein